MFESKVTYMKRITYFNTPYLNSLFVLLCVFACSTLKSLFKLLDVSILILGALPQADRSTSHLFSKGHQLYWKVSVSFSHRSSQRGIRYLSEAEPDNVFPLAPPQSPSTLPFHDPVRSRSPTRDPPCLIYPAGTHELMSPFRSLASDQFYRAWSDLILPQTDPQLLISWYDQVPTSA